MKEFLKNLPTRSTDNIQTFGECHLGINLNAYELLHVNMVLGRRGTTARHGCSLLRPIIELSFGKPFIGRKTKRKNFLFRRSVGVRLRSNYIVNKNEWPYLFSAKELHT